MLLLCEMLLFLAAPSPAPPMQPVWDYHRKELHASIESSNLYEAKRSLAHLRRLDPNAYRNKRFDLTAAWIAEREQNWATALKLNIASGTSDAITALEAAKSLEKLGRLDEALAMAFGKKIKHKGAAKWDAYALAARCHLQLGQRDKAIKYYKKLTSRYAPTMFRTDAYNMLVELYYKHGSPKKARKLAESVQGRFPASDAALFTMYLQERFETPAYLEKQKHITRFAMVCYRNRDFERSNRFFEKIAAMSTGDKAARARYYLALTYVKQGDTEGAKVAFEKEAAFLDASSYAGRAAFQLARTYYLQGDDTTTVRLVSDYWHTSKDTKWRQESTRLWILSLRRLGDLAQFEDLEDILRQEKLPAWLWRYYHKNGMLWAVQEGRFLEARNHLENYLAQGGLKKEARQEAKVWMGLIDWAYGDQEKAVQSWLQVSQQDPNHYFGLTARELLSIAAPETNSWLQASAKADMTNTKDLRMLYYLAPDQGKRQEIGERLIDVFHAKQPAFDFDPASLDAKATQMAEIGRFDRAARVLPKKKRKYLTYHYHKALWYQLSGDIKSSIRHAEILVNSYPKWMPYELLPKSVQQLNFPLGYGEMVAQRAAQKDVDPFLMMAIIREESRFDHNAKSWASARGLMQFIPSTANDMAKRVEDLGTFSLPRLYQPSVAIALGATYVDHLMTRFDGASMHTIAAYNAGEGATARWAGFSDGSRDLAFVWDVTYSETKRYCQKVMRAYHHYSRLYGDPADVITVPDLNQIARL